MVCVCMRVLCFAGGGKRGTGWIALGRLGSSRCMVLESRDCLRFCPPAMLRLGQGPDAPEERIGGRIWPGSCQVHSPNVPPVHSLRAVSACLSARLAGYAQHPGCLPASPCAACTPPSHPIPPHMCCRPQASLRCWRACWSCCGRAAGSASSSSASECVGGGGGGHRQQVTVRVIVSNRVCGSLVSTRVWGPSSAIACAGHCQQVGVGMLRQRPLRRGGPTRSCGSQGYS